jgi:hypothetical protein
VRAGPQLAFTVLLIVAAGCSSSGDDATTTTSVPVTTTVVSTSTAAATSTTVTATSTAPTTTSTTSTSLAPSTTDAEVGLLLSDEGIEAGDVWVPLGSLEGDAVEAVTAVLGPPSDDSGWVDAFSVYGTCPGPVVRGVHWDAFVMLFTQSDTDFWSAGVPHFFAWYYTGVPPELETTEGLVIGDTLETLEAHYGGPDLAIGEDPFDPSAGYWAYDVVGWTGMWGYADGLDPSSTVTSINGGRGCGE